MSNQPTYSARIQSTGEVIELYRLSNGNYFDYRAMGVNDPPTSKSGKKEFTEEEIKIIKPLNN